jgi:hypothetical protein
MRCDLCQEMSSREASLDRVGLDQLIEHLGHV